MEIEFQQGAVEGVSCSPSPSLTSAQLAGLPELLCMPRGICGVLFGEGLDPRGQMFRFGKISPGTQVFIMCSLLFMCLKYAP